ncbi:MAG: GDSL-type esterase/lipase family protein, partial [Thermodesulfobacteriota bacterium]|nr:GDSL-type esterase/lipase family protein [Thermodesulfobacteriota bacterium]
HELIPDNLRDEMKIFQKIVLTLLLPLLLISCDSGKGQQLTPLRPNDILLAFGDSLTSGVGTRPELSYPVHLSRFLARKVINAGVPGETSTEGARRLPGLLDQYKPELLLLFHGGNDILRKLDRQALRTNLQRMYEAANQRDIEVVLIAVPQFGFGIEDVKLYRELADELHIPVLEGTLGKLLGDKRYKSDLTHLNGQGYRKLAEAVADLLADNGALR